MKRSAYVIAINNDPDAPIFRISDLGVVADSVEFVRALIAELGGSTASTIY